MENIRLTGLDDEIAIDKIIPPSENVRSDTQMHEELSKRLFKYVINYIESPSNETHIKMYADDDSYMFLIEEDRFKFFHILGTDNFKITYISAGNEYPPDKFTIFLNDVCVARLHDAISNYEQRLNTRKLVILCNLIGVTDE